MKYYYKQQLVDLLYNRGILKNTTLQQIDRIPNTHGSCCQCQTCGRVYEECVCDHNDLVNALNYIEKK